MAQRTAFPFLSGGPPTAAVKALLAAVAAVPDEGEPLRALRTRIKDAGLWKKERAEDTLGFFELGSGETVRASALTRELRDTDEAERLSIAADWLWTANPLMFKTCLDLLAERPHTRDEIVTYVGSIAYRGRPLSRAQVQSWLQLALGLEIIRVVGIALVTDTRGKSFAARAASFDIEEYLEDELAEDEAAPPPTPPPVAEEGEAKGPAPATSEPPPVASAPHADYSSPHRDVRPVDLALLRRSSDFSDDILAETRKRLDAWWLEQEAASTMAGVEDFGIDAATWMDGASEALYRLAVAAAIVFRLGRGREAMLAAYRGLERSGVLADLFYGTAPDELPTEVDSQALMLASLVARRCAEHPDLAAVLEKQDSAVAAFCELETALGGGLFDLELFWIMRCLGEIGAIRADDIAVVSTVPTRNVRDTLFRLGFLASPYAAASDDLMRAAAAASRATSADRPDAALQAFAEAAGCSYGCSHRRSCGYACRERIDVSRK